MWTLERDEPASITRGRWLRLWLIVVLAILAAGWFEFRTSAFEAWLLPRLAARLTWSVRPGTSDGIVFPHSGPLDHGRGYDALPDFSHRLRSSGYQIAEQARFSPGLVLLTWMGIPPPYHEPVRAGLLVRGADRSVLYDATQHDQQWRRAEDVPPIVVRTLLFMEDRQLGDGTNPHGNPAVDWGRYVKATVLYGGNRLGLPLRVEGGSTLPVQLEKLRHSEAGRTSGPLDKLWQMSAASLRAYRDGPDTRGARRTVILDYLNSVPLAATPGHGEVRGVPEGLRVWFGLEPEKVSDTLREPGVTASKARAFKHVLALLYAVRAPSRYLVREHSLLEQHVNRYMLRLQRAGVVDSGLVWLARRTPLAFAVTPDPPPVPGPDERKAVARIRRELAVRLGVHNDYVLNRLHLEVASSIDPGLQQDAMHLLRQLSDPAFVTANGLEGERLLSQGSPSHVVYSLVLYERTPQGDLLRVQADNARGRFDLNDGMKMELGSTAKLRVLTHYLEIMAQLHAQLTDLDPRVRAARARSARDPLAQWAATTIAASPAMDRAAFLDAALERTYPASPYEVFFTGGGAHTFHNFDPADDQRVLSVREATVHSTNLVFIRLMRDLVRYHTARLPYDSEAVLSGADSVTRGQLLRQAADEEARQILARAYVKFRPSAGDDQLLAIRLLGPQPSSRRLAALFYAWNPGADAQALKVWMARHAMGVGAKEALRLARVYGKPTFGLLDYAYLLDRHPIEVWAAGDLARHPSASWEQMLERSGAARTEAASWLLRTRQRHAQDIRIRSRIERDAFARMTPAWRRLGFPFERLVPSLASAIGSSSDRPIALAELIGIIVGDGVRRPPLAIEALRFAGGTPYETAFLAAAPREERVLAPEVAHALRGLLADVVERGTARRLRGVFHDASGKLIAVGGKTGSGDNRLETFARGGRMTSSKAVNRTAAFAFYIGDRFYGVVTTIVTGSRASQYGFTSALPVAVLGLLAPAIEDRLQASPGTTAAERSARPRSPQPRLASFMVTDRDVRNLDLSDRHGLSARVFAPPSSTLVRAPSLGSGSLLSLSARGD